MDGQELAGNPNTHTLTRFKATQALYKKSIKPIREKKRRTRINASLDELKGLLQGLEGQKGGELRVGGTNPVVLVDHMNNECLPGIKV
ncbi:hypothetical protein NDU88_006734 [Pleurodeles waltl]|uniref:BHLH domain-containing protein n=1 Tax=Pleurodeles waltl TaxID=8319 RepID=A0AAV7VMR0_PLEWA|nr:hypothetical protein NDU88_006734 [Pleurodeles waltl]